MRGDHLVKDQLIFLLEIHLDLCSPKTLTLHFFVFQRVIPVKKAAGKTLCVLIKNNKRTDQRNELCKRIIQGSLIDCLLNLFLLYFTACLDLLQVSLLINKQTGGKKEKKREGGGEESETCGLCVPKTRLGIHLLKFDWLFR